MTLLYDLIFMIFAIVYIPYLLFTGRYHKDFRQRFGIYPRSLLESIKGREVIWVHAVSVGEVMAARLLSEGLLERYPEKRLVISTITKTGNDAAKRFFKDRCSIIYLPVDISYVLNRAFSIIRPRLFIIIETEIWPNLIIALNKRRVPIVLVNGRISPASYGRYLKIKFLIKGILNKITLFCMQSDEYKRRIKNMGAPADKIRVTGNMKFDAADRASRRGRLDTGAIRNDLGLAGEEELFIAGSTHKPEEGMVIRVYKNLLKDLPGIRLLIAPRHIERAVEIEGLARKFGFTPMRTSSMTQCAKEDAQKKVPPILILDTMGRLDQIFSIGTIVFMGGSLMRKGGQNILEPAVFSKPIIFGPHMFNFKDIAETFLNEGAACRVEDEDKLLTAAKTLLEDPKKRERLGSRAKSLIDKNRGATKRNLEAIAELLEKCKI